MTPPGCSLGSLFQCLFSLPEKKTSPDCNLTEFRGGEFQSFPTALHCQKLESAWEICIEQLDLLKTAEIASKQALLEMLGRRKSKLSEFQNKPKKSAQCISIQPSENQSDVFQMGLSKENQPMTEFLCIRYRISKVLWLFQPNSKSLAVSRKKKYLTFTCKYNEI